MTYQMTDGYVVRYVADIESGAVKGDYIDVLTL